ELIDIDYEPLPHVTDVLDALKDTAPVLHPQALSSNLLAAKVDQMGSADEVIQTAPVIVRDSLRIGRVSALPMEPRGAVAVWRAGARELTVHSSTQVPHLLRKQLAESLRLNESCIQVSAGDVGGG